MKLKVYACQNCGTCRKALRFLNALGVNYEIVPVREQPPTRAELKRMLKITGGNVRKLFNTSGQDYKRLRLKDTLPKLSADEAIDLLTSNGNLVKRPFAVTTRSGRVGFDEAKWKDLLK